MYLRTVHAESDLATLCAFIRAYPLGVLTTAIDTLDQRHTLPSATTTRLETRRAFRRPMLQLGCRERGIVRQSGGCVPGEYMVQYYRRSVYSYGVPCGAECG